MANTKLVGEKDLAALARKYRLASGKNRAVVGRELGVRRQAVLYAENQPHKSFTKLRCRMIETYGGLKVTGPYYQITSH